MEEYISEITDNALTLVKQNAKLTDEAGLATDQYFVFIYCASYISYLRNYKGVYTGDFLLTGNTYYLNIRKYGPDHGYYITKHYNKLKNKDKGEILIVTVNDATKCISIDE